MNNETAGIDRFGRTWSKGFVYVNNGDNEKLIILEKVIIKETGKSYFDRNGVGYLHCRCLNNSEKMKIGPAHYTK